MLDDTPMLDQQEMTGTHQLTTTAVDHMRRASRWMKFLAIVGFCMTALVVATSIVVLQSPVFGTGFMVIYLVIAIVSFFLNLFLFQTASFFRRFADGGEISDGENAFIKLNTLSTFTGVLTIIYLAFIIVMIVTGGFAALLLGGAFD